MALTELVGPEVVSAVLNPEIIIGTGLYLVLKPILKQSGLIDKTKGAYKNSMVAYNVLMALYSATAFIVTGVALGWDRGYGQWLRDLTGDKVVTLYTVRRRRRAAAALPHARRSATLAVEHFASSSRRASVCFCFERRGDVRPASRAQDSCPSPVFNSKLFVWAAWSFYYSKYFEYLDTAWLVLKGKDVSFLQTFHH
eukprot:6974450-Prymnesium_polylepis.1